MKAEDGAWAGRSAGAAEEPEPATAGVADPDMRPAKAEEADEKAGPSAKKDAAEDEASTAPLPEKVPPRWLEGSFMIIYDPDFGLKSQ